MISKVRAHATHLGGTNGTHHMEIPGNVKILCFTSLEKGEDNAYMIVYVLQLFCPGVEICLYANTLTNIFYLQELVAETSYLSYFIV